MSIEEIRTSNKQEAKNENKERERERREKKEVIGGILSFSAFVFLYDLSALLSRFDAS